MLWLWGELESYAVAVSIIFGIAKLADPTLWECQSLM